jgi:sporulation protein YlmC with PRC-barrel domain
MTRECHHAQLFLRRRRGFGPRGRNCDGAKRHNSERHDYYEEPARDDDDSTVGDGPSQKQALNMPAETPNFINLDSRDMLSSNVVGLDIYNDQNNDIGKIQDIAFDSSNRVMGYILSVGGFLGMGTHYVAVDPDAVKVTYDASNKVWRATMNATKDQLKAAPEFKYQGQWNASRS